MTQVLAPERPKVQNVPSDATVILRQSADRRAVLHIDIERESYSLLLYPGHTVRYTMALLDLADEWYGLEIMDEISPVHIDGGILLYWLAAKDGEPL